MESAKVKPQPQPVVQPETTFFVPKEEYAAFSAWREQEKRTLPEFEKMLVDSMEDLKELASDYKAEEEDFSEIVDRIALFYPEELENVLQKYNIKSVAPSPKNNESIDEVIDNATKLVKLLFGKK